jgi:ATP-dependent RNA helicase RhlB
LTRKLKGNDFPAMGITGTVPQKKRLKIMQQFKAGEIQILVATDVASRGIHVEDIDIVINYDIPQDPEDYVHRIGRTGRAGKAGRAITLACETYVYHLEAIEALIQERIRVDWASDDLFEKDQVPSQPRRKPRAGRKNGARQEHGRIREGVNRLRRDAAPERDVLERSRQKPRGRRDTKKPNKQLKFRAFYHRIGGTESCSCLLFCHVWQTTGFKKCL